MRLSCPCIRIGSVEECLSGDGKGRTWRLPMLVFLAEEAETTLGARDSRFRTVMGGLGGAVDSDAET